MSGAPDILAPSAVEVASRTEVEFLLLLDTSNRWRKMREMSVDVVATSMAIVMYQKVGSRKRTWHEGVEWKKGR